MATLWHKLFVYFVSIYHYGHIYFIGSLLTASNFFCIPFVYIFQSQTHDVVIIRQSPAIVLPRCGLIAVWRDGTCLAGLRCKRKTAILPTHRFLHLYIMCLLHLLNDLSPYCCHKSKILDGYIIQTIFSDIVISIITIRRFYDRTYALSLKQNGDSYTDNTESLPHNIAHSATIPTVE